MAVAFDAQSSASSTANGVTSHNHTNLTVGSGANRALLVMVAWSTTVPTGITVTWDNGASNQACTLITNASHGSATGGNRSVQLYGLVAPVSGNKTLRVAWTGAADVYVDAIAVTGADQTGGATTFPNGTSANGATGPGATNGVTITSAVGDYVIAAHVTPTNAVSSVNQTQAFINNSAAGISAGGNRAVGAATVSCTATYDTATPTWSSVGTSIKASAATAYTLSAAAGSFAETGTAATPKHGWKPAAAAGSFAITGSTATLNKGKFLAAAAGAFAETGTAATPKHGWKLAAAAGSFVVTGSTATLTYGTNSVAVASTSTLAYGTRTNSTITAPSGIADGNVLVAILHVGDATAEPSLAVTPPAGWTELTGSPIEASRPDPYTLSLRFYSKVASSESGNYTFTHASGESEGIIYRLTGASTTSPINPNPTVNESVDNPVATGQTTTGLSITTAVNGSLVIMASDAWDGPPTDPPTGTTPTFTERYQGTIFYACDGVMATAGATGDKSHANANASTALPWCCVMIAVATAAAAAFSLSAPSGSFVETGTAATPKHAWTLSAAAGSFAETGSSVTLTKSSPTNKTLSVLPGAFAETGTAASPLHGWKLGAAAGSYAFTGDTVAVFTEFVVQAGSYAFTGSTATFRHAWVMSAAAGSFLETGSAATPTPGKKTTGVSGSFLMTGTAAALTKSGAPKSVAALSGAWTFTGQPASPILNRKVAAAAGSFLFTGTSATLTANTSKRLVVLVGQYNLIGNSATLRYSGRPANGTGGIGMTFGCFGMSPRRGRG